MDEQIFAGEATLDVQQEATRARDTRRTADETTSLIPREQGLVTDDADDEPESHDDRPQWRKPSIYWLLPFALIYTLGFGGLAVPKINLTVDLICRDYFYERSLNDPNSPYTPVILNQSNPQCQIPEVQAKVARFNLYMSLIGGTLAALMSPRLGRLSDRYGRTKIIALCGFGAACTELITCIVATWPDRVSVNLFMLGSMIDGLAGSLTGAQVMLHSYATDCTTPDRRSVAFGLFHGALFLGVAAGPSGAAYIIYNTGNALIVFYMGFLLHFAFSLAIFFIVPESLPKALQLAARAKHRISEESRWLSWENLNPINLVSPLAILFPPIGRPSTLFPNNKGATPALRRNVLILALIDMTVFGIAMGLIQVLVIYARFAFNWGDVETSIFAAIVNGVRTVNLFIVLPLISRAFRKPVANDGKIGGCDQFDVNLIRVSIVLDTIGFVGYTLSSTGPQFTVSGLIACFGGMGPPTLQSAITKHVSPDQVGLLLGVTGLLHALARIVAPTVLNLIYSLTVGTFPQAVFVILTGVFGSVVILSFFIRPHAALEDESAFDVAVEANEDGEGEGDRLLSSH